MSALLTALFLLHSATATYNDAASNVVSAASVLNKDVTGWSSAKGLQGALAIQNDFPAFSSELGNFQKSVDAINVGDLDVQASLHLISTLEELLDNLSQKAADFSAVSATGIVAGDLKSLSSPATGIVNGVIKLIGEDNAKLQALSSPLEDLEGKFNSANKAYGVNELQFSAIPKAAAGSSAASSASSASSASNSAASSAVAASSSKAAVPAKSTAAIVASNVTGNATVTTKSVPGVHNGAQGIIVPGMAGLAAGAVALLL